MAGLQKAQQPLPVRAAIADASGIAADQQPGDPGWPIRARPRLPALEPQRVGIERRRLQCHCNPGMRSMLRIGRQHEREVLGPELPERSVEDVERICQSRQRDVRSKRLGAGRDDEIGFRNALVVETVDQPQDAGGRRTAIDEHRGKAARPAPTAHIRPDNLRRTPPPDGSSDPLRQLIVTRPAVRQDQDAKRRHS